MALGFRPHTAHIKAVVQDTDSSGFRTNPSPIDQTTTARGYLEPKDPNTIYQTWGVMTKAPHTFNVNLPDAALFPLNAEVTIGGRTFTVSAEPKRYDGGTAVDYAEILLDYLEVPKP